MENIKKINIQKLEENIKKNKFHKLYKYRIKSNKINIKFYV